MIIGALPERALSHWQCLSGRGCAVWCAIWRSLANDILQFLPVKEELVVERALETKILVFSLIMALQVDGALTQVVVSVKEGIDLSELDEFMFFKRGEIIVLKLFNKRAIIAKDFSIQLGQILGLITVLQSSKVEKEYVLSISRENQVSLMQLVVNKIVQREVGER